jgi:cell division protein FtsW
MKLLSVQARVFFITVYVLVCFGVIMTYSASAIYAEHVYHRQEYFLLRQFFYAAIGTVLMLMTAATPLQFWKEHARTMMLLAIFFLIIVYLPVIGRSGGGAQRWIRLGPFNFQPAEFAKVVVCLYLADYLTRKIKTIKKGSLSIFLPPLILIGLICGLTLMQPDLGSTAFIVIMVALMFFLAGIRMHYVLGALLIIIPIFYFLVIRVPYRAARVTAYLNPWDDPQGSGFQIIQSFLAFGTGGVKGVGLGQGIQKLFYLPSSYNDFIFSIIGEELGMIGLLVVVVLYGVLFVSGMQMAQNARQDYDRLLILSLTFMIVLQAIIHMLVTTGLIPTKGLPLPFVSFGGTSLVFNLMAVGLLLAADRHVQGKG